MDRRGFFKLLAGGALGSVLDIEKMLWVPGAKTIFIPAPSEYDAITAATYKYFSQSVIYDNIFTTDPLLNYLTSRMESASNNLSRDISEAIYYAT